MVHGVGTHGRLQPTFTLLASDMHYQHTCLRDKTCVTRRNMQIMPLWLIYNFSSDARQEFSDISHLPKIHRLVVMLIYFGCSNNLTTSTITFVSLWNCLYLNWRVTTISYLFVLTKVTQPNTNPKPMITQRIERDSFWNANLGSPRISCSLQLL